MRLRMRFLECPRTVLELTYVWKNSRDSWRKRIGLSLRSKKRIISSRREWHNLSSSLASVELVSAEAAWLVYHLRAH